jgi:hypothetical protein
MSYIEEKFELMHKRFIDQLIFINYGYNYFMHIHKRTRDRINELNIASGFFGLALESIYIAMLINLLKLYKKSSSFTLSKFLDFIASNLNIFKWENKLKRINSKFAFLKIPFIYHS